MRNQYLFSFEFEKSGTRMVLHTTFLSGTKENVKWFASNTLWTRTSSFALNYLLPGSVVHDSSAFKLLQLVLSTEATAQFAEHLTCLKLDENDDNTESWFCEENPYDPN